MGLEVGDLNNDGYPDVLIGTGDMMRAAADVILCHNGASAVLPARMFYRCGNSVILGHRASPTYGIVLADYDHDGDVDIIYNLGGASEQSGRRGGQASMESPAQGGILPTIVDPTPYSATVHLQGSVSNRSAVGARLRVEGSQVHYYWVQSRQGFQGQNSDGLLVTLGSLTHGTVTVT